MSRSRLLAVALAAVAGLGMLGPAGAVAAAPAMVEPGCVVRDATLHWGFKESFRAYIDGDIANGEWTTDRGATYETPEFSWPNGQGRYDPETGLGYVQFLGTVRFTGHEGLLDTTIADPTLSISRDGAFLLLDVSGPVDGGRADRRAGRRVRRPAGHRGVGGRRPRGAGERFGPDRRRRGARSPTIRPERHSIR